MYRMLFVLVCAGTIAGCRQIDDRETLKLLPEHIQAQSYQDLVRRAKTQVRLATEAFYIDDFLDVEDAARALEQTARFLPKAKETPSPLAAIVSPKAKELGQTARQLRIAARAKDVDKVQANLQKLHLSVRILLNKGKSEKTSAPK